MSVTLPHYCVALSDNQQFWTIVSAFMTEVSQCLREPLSQCLREQTCYVASSINLRRVTLNMKATCKNKNVRFSKY